MVKRELGLTGDNISLACARVLVMNSPKMTSVLV